MRSPVRLRASALAGHTAALREGYDHLVLPERGRHCLSACWHQRPEGPRQNGVRSRLRYRSGRRRTRGRRPSVGAD
jgi:hypothetical protein